MKLAWQWETFGLTFPVSEMEAGLPGKMAACLSAYKAVRERNVYVLRQRKTDAEFRKNYPQLAAICKEIRELRERKNGE